MKKIFVYDDTVQKSEIISDIVGQKSFGDIIVKGKRLEDIIKSEVIKLFPDVIYKKICSPFEYQDLIRKFESYHSENIRIIHFFSNYVISDASKLMLSFRKIEYVDSCTTIFSGGGGIAAGLFPTLSEYNSFLQSLISGQKPQNLIRKYFEADGLIDISNIENFIQYITVSINNRYFNSLKWNKYTLVKSSTNKNKIKAEYEFYNLLPDDMKFWFVMPFDYHEEKNFSSYAMERLYIPDLSFKWINSSISDLEFENLLDKYFYFFQSRHKKECSMDEYKKVADALYIEKVNERIAALKKLKEYQRFETLLLATDAELDKLTEKYFELKQIIESRNDYKCHLVIGHGDPCFSNCLYNKSTQFFKFIDPKGALTEKELWTNPYYDVAKLSHSVCGDYDFFNNGLFDIKLSENFSLELKILFDNKKYKNIFKEKLIKNGFDYLTVRIYEASLFLSMLPLHIDNPHKVFAFILNVKNILKEVEADV